MQSSVAMRGGVRDVTAEQQLDLEVNTRMELQGKLDNDGNDDDGDNHDFLDDNDFERIFSRKTVSRRKLDLFEAPEFVKRLSSYQEANVGDTVTFSGQYKAFPKPTVKWFKDEEEVIETKRHNIDLSSETEGIVRLIIQEVIRKDEGAYKCKVENQEGVASTTGYLSVSSKSADKSQYLQSKKSTQDRVSTPPYLRPIAEQKSVEEREEKEYQCLPPSPLQEFMDKIRHSAKSMHGPIIYADLADVYPDEDVIKDFNEETVQDEEDVFDDERDIATPSESSNEEIIADESLPNPREKSNIRNETRNEPNSIQVVDEFISPLVDLKTAQATTSQISNEDNAYGSDGHDNLNPVLCSDLESKNPNGNRRNRRLKLILQRSHALEISESDNSFTGQHNDAPQYAEREMESKTINNNDDDHLVSPGFHNNANKTEFKAETSSDKKKSNEILSSIQKNSEHFTKDSENVIDVILRWIESPFFQFFIGVAVTATTFALATDIPTVYLIAVLILLSFISFFVIERRLKSEY